MNELFLNELREVDGDRVSIIANEIGILFSRFDASFSEGVVVLKSMLALMQDESGFDLTRLEVRTSNTGIPSA